MSSTKSRRSEKRRGLGVGLRAGLGPLCWSGQDVGLKRPFVRTRASKTSWCPMYSISNDRLPNLSSMQSTLRLHINDRPYEWLGQAAALLTFLLDSFVTYMWRHVPGRGFRNTDPGFLRVWCTRGGGEFRRFWWSAGVGRVVANTTCSESRT